MVSESRAAQPRELSVVVAGGGSAGHVEPALAVADALRALGPHVRVTALGTARGLETRLVPERGYPLALIPPVPLPRKLTGDLLRLPWRVRAAVARTREVLADTRADVVVGFGGYVALPAYLAASWPRSRVPVVVHEANVKAGIANKIGARRAARVLAAVPDSGVHAGGARDAEVVGIPVRDSITGLDRAALRPAARAAFGLPAQGPVLLVFGGSQGARTLNNAVAGAARELLEAGISVLHAHGPKNHLELPEIRGVTAKYVAVPYLSQMDQAYAAADMAVCRAGAMSVAEVSAVGLPAVYVPLPHGNGEQALNAGAVVRSGGGILVADSDLTPGYVTAAVVPLLRDTARLAEMSAAAISAGHHGAAAEVARIVADVAKLGVTERREQ